MTARRMQIRLPAFRNRGSIGILFLGVCLFTVYLTGIVDVLFQSDYGDFEYPYDGNIARYVLQLKAGKSPDIPPLNTYNYDILISSNQEKCKDFKDDDKTQDGGVRRRPDGAEIRVVMMIKSALKNRERRDAIRKSWGENSVVSGVKIRRVFMLGNIAANSKENRLLRTSIFAEDREFGDLIQADFVDNYFNNTIKTLVAFRWVVNFCSDADYVFFSDDDMFVSAKNLVNFIRNPFHYPDYLELQEETGSAALPEVMLETHLFAGHVSFVRPMRDRFSKWYVSLQEYPYSMYPSFINAGAYLLSTESLRDLYFTSLYTKHFRFDDVFVGIVARKAKMAMFHSDHFHRLKKDYDALGYRYVISSHGYEDPDELLRVWKEQRRLGYA